MSKTWFLCLLLCLCVAISTWGQTPAATPSDQPLTATQTAVIATETYSPVASIPSQQEMEKLFMLMKTPTVGLEMRVK